MSQPIVFFIPFIQPHKVHIPHAMEWYAENKKKHNLVLEWVPYRPLHKAQAQAVRRARKIGASHILFTENDHWGYPMDGLEVLLEHEKDVVGFMTHYKGPPFLPMCMKKVDPAVSMIGKHRNLRPFWPAELTETDLLTWAFTLVKLDVFDRMEAAGKDPFLEWAEVPTDSYFCQYCEDMGIPRWVDPACMIEHGDIPNSHIPTMRRAFDLLNIQARRLKADHPMIVDEDHDEIPYVSELQREFQQAQEVVA